MTSLSLSKGSKNKLEFKITAPNSLLRFLKYYKHFTWFQLTCRSWYTDGNLWRKRVILDLAFTIWKTTERRVISWRKREFKAIWWWKKAKWFASAMGLVRKLHMSILFAINILNRLLCTDIVEFDNSFSYVRSKHIWYRVVIDLVQSSPTVPFEDFDG